MSKTIIIGRHRSRDSIARHFDTPILADSPEAVDGETREAVVLADMDAEDPLKADSAAIAMVEEIARRADTGNGRVKVHLMLRSNTSLLMLRRGDLRADLREKIDLYPFTMEDEWSRRVRTDHRAVTLDAEHTVHLIVLGTSGPAERVAVNAALTAHFPNYTRDKSLRTRITFVAPDAEEFMGVFTERYRHLMDNSWYRLVDAGAERPVRMVHKPMYNGEREEFVDVEWEFVKGTVYSPIVRRRLQQRSHDPRHVTTVVSAPSADDDNLNVTTAMNLPTEVRENLPVYVWVHDASLLESLGESRLIPIGMDDRGYDPRLPLVEMGKTVNYIYGRAYSDNIEISHPEDPDGMPVFTLEIDDAEREKGWDRLGAVKRMSNIFNAMTIPVKLRSVGIDDGDISRFYELSAREIALLAEVEHNRWSVEELILGFRPCTPDEERSVEADISLKRELRDRMVHYDLRAYNDLRDDSTGKNVNVYDICLSGCLPLIAKTHSDETE